MVTGLDVICNDFGELVDSCAGFYEENKKRMELGDVREKRASLCDFIEGFHNDCGTLTPAIQKKIDDLKDGVCVILMTAHQPNLFAYSGVLRKATLNFVLAKQLEKRLKVPVVNFFGVADQDFTDDRWVRSSLLPAVTRRGGVLSIDMELPERLMLNMVPKPSLDRLKQWKAEIERWLDDAVGSVERLGKAYGLPRLSSTGSVRVLRGNFRFFWKLVEDCFERSATYSDFNAFVMSKIVNEVWGYDTVFSRFSECQQIFVREFGFLLSRFSDYSRLLREANELLGEEGFGGGVSDQEPGLAPFWYHCDCGSKVRLFLAEKDGLLIGQGSCVGCGRYQELEFGAVNDPDISDVASRISARAIPMNLVFFEGLCPCCYVGGFAGAKYLMEARHVAEGLGIPFPPIAVWRPHDEYAGIGQIEAMLELKRICTNLGVRDLPAAMELLKSRIAEIRERLDRLEASKKRIMEKLREHPNDEKLKQEIKTISLSQTEVKRSFNLSVINHELKILENIPVVLDLIPSIIDYAVNVGLKETSDQWVRYLNENGSLSSDVHLEPVLSRVMGLDCSLSANGSLIHADEV